MQGSCPQCGSQVAVLLPSVTCARCGQDLAPLLPADELADAFYQLAAQQARQGNVVAALSVLEQGLARVERSDLRLLAALLYRGQGNYEAMRRHVAAIPLDDVLRSEAEWLIRNHQARVRQEREQAKAQSARPSPESAGRWPQMKVAWLGVPLILVLMVGAVTVWTVARVPSDSAALGGEAPRVPATSETRPIPQITAVASPTTAPTTAPTSPPTATPWPKVVTAPEQPDTPTPSPTPGVQIVQPVSPMETPTPEAVASTDLQDIIQIAVQEPVDLATYLESQGRPDLAALPVAAVLNDRQLIVRGVVPFTRQRMDLLELLSRYPGVDEVRAVDLVVRLPETYVVQPEDTLWTIAYRLYGEGTLWPLLVEANPDVLSDPARLAPGMEIVVPPRP